MLLSYNLNAKKYDKLMQMAAKNNLGDLLNEMRILNETKLKTITGQSQT